MCGIAGIIDFREPAIARGDVERLTLALHHRGPDDGGIEILAHAGLGARRLSIVDLSERGHMPMSDPTGRVWIVHNGEVYNFPELRRELENKGRRFRSGTDTEVVLHAYQEWGDSCVERFAGMFAFAIWDAPRRRLFAARDRLGVKPLFLTRTDSRLAFASEVHALYQHVRPDAESIDLLSLDHYLGFGYVPPGGSFVRNIGRVPPAHTLVFDESGMRIARYWRVKFRPSRIFTFAEAADEIDAALGRAVKRRLLADVPLGCFLSGGIDSGLIAAHAARATSGRLRTFSVGFEGNEEDRNELGLARLVAERYATDHTEIQVRPATSDLLPRILWHYGEPFADASAFAVYQISQVARSYITVALSGDGGDESFGGYGNVRAAGLAQLYRERIPAGLRSVVECVAHCPVPLPQRDRFARWIDHYVNATVVEQNDLPDLWTVEMRRALYDPALGIDYQAHTGNRLLEELHAEADGLLDAEKHLYIDLHRRLPGDYLTKVDIATSMASLELRSPFLDHELVELAASLPLGIKMPRGRQKGLLRHLAARHLPAQVVSAPKRGFSPPVHQWLRGEWLPILREVVGRRLAGREKLFNPQQIHIAIEEHAEGRRDHTARLYALLCLEVWWELFIDRTLSPGDPL